MRSFRTLSVLCWTVLWSLTTLPTLLSFTKLGEHPPLMLLLMTAYILDCFVRTQAGYSPTVLSVEPASFVSVMGHLQANLSSFAFSQPRHSREHGGARRGHCCCIEPNELHLPAHTGRSLKSCFFTVIHGVTLNVLFQTLAFC